jgi:AcrR family transcriptional regulator
VARPSKAGGAGREPLTRERILRAAIDVADADGLDGVTMRRVGQALGVEAMALYNHVPGKAALLDGMADMLIARIEAAPAGTEWKAAIRMQALSARAILRRHPWAEGLFARQVGISLTLMRYLEDITGHLLDGGLSSQLTHTAVHVLGSRILGFGRDIFDPEARQFPAAIETALFRGDYPYAARIIAEATHDPDVEFAFGLDLILDGLERARDLEPRVVTA